MTHTALCNDFQFPWLTLWGFREEKRSSCSLLWMIKLFELNPCVLWLLWTVINSDRLNCELANDQRGQWASSNCCFTQLWAILWELKTKSRSYVRMAWVFFRLDIASIPTPTYLFIRYITVTKFCSASFIVWPYKSHPIIYSFT